MMLNIILLFLR